MTPWMRAAQLDNDDDDLKRLLSVAPVALPNIMGASSDDLLRALRSFHRASDQDVEIAREISALMRAHARTVYSSLEQFERFAKGTPPAFGEPPIRMFTGPTGAGKSRLIDALVRQKLGLPPVQVGTGLPPFPLTPFAHLTVRSGIAPKATLNSLATSVGLADFSSKSIASAIALLRQRLYQRGVSLVVADELQFLSMSARASDRVTGLLDMLAELGPPVLFVCNYSLGHKLAGRPPEQQRRFLGSPLVMMPMLPDGADFADFIADCNVVLGGALKLDMSPGSDDLRRIHGWTYGLRVFVCELVVAAVMHARPHAKAGKGQLVVTMGDFEAAYMATAYAAARKIVESSFSADQKHLSAKDAKNFTCPVPLLPSAEQVARRLASERRDRELNEAMRRAGQTPAERKATGLQSAPLRCDAETTQTKQKKSAAFRSAEEAKALLRRVLK